LGGRTNSRLDGGLWGRGFGWQGGGALGDEVDAGVSVSSTGLHHGELRVSRAIDIGLPAVRRLCC